MAKITITARQAQSTRMSPFFMQHRYEVDPIQIAVKHGPENRPQGRRVQEDYCQDAGPHPLRHEAKKERIINEH
jgi:hypothetical protein